MVFNPTQEDLVQLNGLGLTVEKVQEQIDHFKEGFPKARLDDAATPDNGGIRVLSDKEITRYVRKYRQLSRGRKILKFDAENYNTDVASGATWIGQAYSTDATQVMLGNRSKGLPPRSEIGFVLPKEGFVIAFDEMVVSSHSRNPDLAYAFIDYVYRSDVAKANMEYIMGLMPVKPGIEALDENFRDRIMLDAETIERGQVLDSFENDVKTINLYNNAWTRIKLPEEVK